MVIGPSGRGGVRVYLTFSPTSLTSGLSAIIRSTPLSPIDSSATPTARTSSTQWPRGGGGGGGIPAAPHVGNTRCLFRRTSSHTAEVIMKATPAGWTDSLLHGRFSRIAEQLEYKRYRPCKLTARDQHYTSLSRLVHRPLLHRQEVQE